MLKDLNISSFRNFILAFIYIIKKNEIKYL